MAEDAQNSGRELGSGPHIAKQLFYFFKVAEISDFIQQLYTQRAYEFDCKRTVLSSLLVVLLEALKILAIRGHK